MGRKLGYLQKQYLLLPGQCQRCAAYGPRVVYDFALNNEDESYGVSNPHADYAMNIQKQQRGEISLTWFTELMKCQQFREVVQERYQHTMRPLLENWSETCNDYRSTLETPPGWNLSAGI